MQAKEIINNAKERQIKRKAKKKEDRLLQKERELNYYSVAKRGYLENHKIKIAPPEYIISLQNINKIYSNMVQAVFDFNLDIKEKEFIVFVGPSGCGKSTTLRMIAGLEDITAGDLYLNHRYCNDIEPKRRDISMVFQSYALYPNMTVRENLSFGLKIKHLKKEEINEKVEKVAKTLELEEYLDRKPAALSGGQRQRVALGRALVKESSIFLMDEPLSNLDAKLRVQMRSEIVSLHKKVGATTIYVTHDQTEAMTMADRIVVMSKGRVQQIGTPEEVYSEPANLFVATFIGSPSMNTTPASLKDFNEICFDNAQSLKISNERKEIIEKFIDKQINFYKTEISDINESIENRKLYLSSKSLRFKIDSLDKIESKYSKKENTYRANIASLHKAVDDGDLDGTKEGIAELETSLNSLLFKKEKEINNVELKYKAILEEEKNHLKTQQDELRIKEIYEKDEELAVYLKKLSDFKYKLSYYLNAKTFKKLDVIFGIRPENINAHSNIENIHSQDEFKVKLSLVELLGYEYYLYFSFNNTKFIAKANHGKYKFMAETEEILSFDEEKIYLFDKESSLRIF